MAAASMNVLVTGGLGFVMSNAVRHLLEADPHCSVVTLDLGPVSNMTAEFFRLVRDRVIHVQGDIRDRALLDHLGKDSSFTHVLHGATITHLPLWERQQPSAFIEVNLSGTVGLLEWARARGVGHFLYVSSGAVYGNSNESSPRGPQPEDGPINPSELYGISKYAAELIVWRYGELFPMQTTRVRFSGVFGPMERPTLARATMSLPYQMARSVIESRPLRLTAPTLLAGGDFLSAEDIGSALTALLTAEARRHDVYNIAFGRFTPVSELLQAFQTVVPAFGYELADAAAADVAMDPAHRLARWNAYDIGRMTAEFGWRPRPLVEQLASYWAWIKQNPAEHCPPVNRSQALAVPMVEGTNIAA